jgi:ElaB/YqjD/DUF883 family membrane-anchored ribosome-binding protein
MPYDEERHEYGTGTYAHRWNVDWRRISWGAIFAGTFVALALFLTLQILGLGIGATTIDPATGETPSASTLGIGAAIWWFITGLIALFIGGWVAGRLGWLPTKLDRILHGLTTWAFFYVVMFYLLTTTLSTLVGGGLSILGQTASAAGQATAAVVEPGQGQQVAGQGLSLDTIRQQIVKAMGGTPQQAQQADLSQLASAVSDYLRGPQTEQERQQLAQEISQVTGQTQAQANQTIANLEQQTQQAVQTGEEVVNVAGTSFIILAIAMLLGAVAAALGGLAVPTPRATYPYDRDRGHEVPAERETYAAH